MTCLLRCLMLQITEYLKTEREFFLLAPEKIEIVHKTIDERKEEIGINFNKLSDSELLDMINGVQCR